MNIAETVARLDRALKAEAKDELFEGVRAAHDAVMNDREAMQALADAYAAKVAESPMWAVFSGALVESGADAAALSAAVLAQVRRMPLDAEPVGGMTHLAAAGTAVWTVDAKGRAAARTVAGLIPALERWSAAEHGEQTQHTFETLRHVLGAVDGEPLVIWFPGLGEAWRVSVHGAINMQQLYRAAAAGLAEPLRRIGALARPDTAETFSCDFHFFLPASIEPSDGLPTGNRAAWKAPGGWGSGSLPQDFLVADLPRVGDERMVVAVGPKDSATSAVREMPANAAFYGRLEARLGDVRRLDEAESQALAKRIVEYSSTYMPSDEERAMIPTSPVVLGFARPRDLPTRSRAPLWVAGIAFIVLFLYVLSRTRAS